MNILDRYRGCLLGLACGDALGTTLEFTPPDEVQPVTDIIGGGPFSLPAGAWTDDTSMALCLAESLIESKGFDAKDQMARYCRWWKNGYWSSTGRCFDIGITTRQALASFLLSGNAVAGSTDPNSAGNGSLMRLAPVPLFFAADPARAIEMAADSSRTTHGTAECVDACRYFAALLVGAVQGRSKDELLADHFDPAPEKDSWTRQPLAPKVAAIAAGSFKHKEPPAIRGGGYVVDCLEAALWAFARGEDFADVVRRAVNLGDDADTTGAVAGQLAGAYYGVEAIPQRWLVVLAMKKEIEELAGRLHQMAGAR
jgi:ADP-ribosyl-[dinitrogen reductase] hydrolase